MQILDKKAIIKRLKTWRETNNLNCRKFALAAGVDPGHYSKVESEKMLITENMLVRFFEKYSGLSRNHILYGSEHITTNPAKVQPPADHVPVTGFKGETAVELAEKIISLAPVVYETTPVEDLYKSFSIRESKYVLAFNLLKQTIAELEAEVQYLKDQSGK